MSNQALEDFLSQKGIEFFRCDVGDKYVLETMQREGLNFGGEQSGHIILSDYAKTGDGLAAALQVVSIILKDREKASKTLNPFELYPQILVNMSIKKKIPLHKIDGFKELVKKLQKQNLRPLIRYSGTENLLRILLEGKDAKLVAEKIKDIEKFFDKKLNG
jgi:phosphoglucosamine mutase